MRTDLGKRTHQCDEAQGNNSTRALSTKTVFFWCKKIDKKKKDNFCQKRSCTVVSFSFVASVSTFSLELFYFVKLTSNCSLIH